MNSHQIKWIHKVDTNSFHIINIWPNIQFIVIDKISIVGYTLLATKHLNLQKIKI